MNRKFSILFIFLFLLVITNSSLVLAVSPFSTQQFTTGYSIKFPPTDIIKFGLPYTFNFHVYNISNGMPITDAQCFFHLYNSTGNHLLTLSQSTVDHQFDYEFKVLAGNFTIGMMSYVAQCNNSAQGLGGFVEMPFEVTTSGINLVSETDSKFNTIIIFFVFLALAIGFLIFGITQQNILFSFFSGLMFIVAGVYIFVNPTQYLSSLLNSVLAYILWGVGAYLLVLSGIKGIQEGF